jgi:hypothetical protein
MTNHEELIDISIVPPAAAALEQATSRLQDARRRLAVEQAAHADAKRAAERAESLGGDDAFECDEALANAQRRLDVAARIAASATEAHQQAAASLDAAKVESYRPVAAAGFRALLAASEKHDAAVALMAEAESDRADAVALTMVAHGQGFQVQHALSSIHAHVQVPAQLRRTYMAGSRIDPDTGDLR